MPVILRISDVMEITKLSKSSIYAFERAGTFPKRIKLGPKAVGWNAADVDAWVRSRQVAV